jgi:predicted metalloprotease
MPQDQDSSTDREACGISDQPIVVYPETSTIGTTIEVSGGISMEYPGDQFMVEVRLGGNQGQLVYDRTITLDPNCEFAFNLVSESGDQAGRYRLLVKDASGLIYAAVDFWLEEEQAAEQPAEQGAGLDCASDEYFRAGVNFKDALEYWFGQIDDYWAANFEEYFDYRFEGGAYDRPSLVFTPDPPQCDDGRGYSAQYLSNFNVVSGEMTVNEVRFDGPAFMDEYLEWREAVPLVVLSHEFGHVLQVQSGLVNPGSPDGLGSQAELQADCFAGAYLQHLDNQGRITGAAMQQALEFHSQSGDLEGTNIPHGTSSERLNAIYTGLEGGTEACLFFYTP